MACGTPTARPDEVHRSGPAAWIQLLQIETQQVIERRSNQSVALGQRGREDWQLQPEVWLFEVS